MPDLSRRHFLRSSLITGASLPLIQAQQAPPSDQLQIALIGCGNWGKIIADALHALPNETRPHCRAVCDLSVRESNGVAGVMKSRGHSCTPYLNLDHLLAAEANQLDAVLIATPDFVHHSQTIACLEHGLDVYCEAPLSHRLGLARDLVLAAQQTNSHKQRPFIVQIGHHLLSRPDYRLAKTKVHDKYQLLGSLRAAQVQSHFGAGSRLYRRIPQGRAFNVLPDGELLRQHGFNLPNLPQISPIELYLNWRMLPQFSGESLGPRLSNQLAYIVWFFDRRPRQLYLQTLGLPRPPEVLPGLPANDGTIQGIYRFGDGEHSVSCHVSKMLENAFEGPGEYIFGTHATLKLDEHFRWERPPGLFPNWNGAILNEDQETDFRQAPAPWRRDLAAAFEERILERRQDQSSPFFGFDPGWTPPHLAASAANDSFRWPDPSRSHKITTDPSTPPPSFALNSPDEDFQALSALPPQAPHLLNFFQAVRSGRREDLHCPPETAYAALVMTLRGHDAVANGGLHQFDPQDFIARPGEIREPAGLG